MANIIDQLLQTGAQGTSAIQGGAQSKNVIDSALGGGGFASQQPTQQYNPFDVDTWQYAPRDDFIVPTSNVTGIGSTGGYTPQTGLNQSEISFDPWRGQTISEEGMPKTWSDYINPIGAAKAVAQGTARQVAGLGLSVINPILKVAGQKPMYTLPEAAPGFASDVQNFFFGEAPVTDTLEWLRSSARELPEIYKSQLPGNARKQVLTPEYLKTENVPGIFAEQQNWQEAIEKKAQQEKKPVNRFEYALPGVSAFLQGATTVATMGDLLGEGAALTLKNIKVPSPTVQAASNLLGKPATLQEAEQSYRILQRKFHPDMPTGNSEISSSLNDAISILRKEGIPQAPGKIAGGARKVAETLTRPRTFAEPLPEFATDYSQTAYADVRGLLPERAGFINTEPFQPYRQPQFGLSIKAIPLKPLVKVAQKAPTYENFVGEIADDLLVNPEQMAALQDSGLTLRGLYDQVKSGTTKVAQQATANQLPGFIQKRLAEITANAKPAVQKAYQFYSPNVEENLTFEDAVKRLSSDNQTNFRVAAEGIDSQLGLKATSKDALGDWSDGAENTVFNIIDNAPDFETVRYSAALKGALGNQKAVIPFMEDSAGADTLYTVAIDNTKASMVELRKALDETGLQYRTLIPSKGATEVVIYDPGSSLASNVEKLVEKYDTTASGVKGTGEFLGGETREAGAAKYGEVIAEYEKSHPNARTAKGESVPNIGDQNAEAELPDFIRKRLEQIRGEGGVMPPGGVPPTPPGIPPQDLKFDPGNFGLQENKGVISKFINGIRKYFNPQATVTPTARQAFSDWSADMIKAKEAANVDVYKLNVPEQEGMDTILKYEAGTNTPYTEEIRNAFDDAFIEAKERGFIDLKHRKNYLPQVYDNTPEEVSQAMAHYMADNGVSGDIIKEYLLKNGDLPKEVASRLNLNPSFIKERVFPSYDVAMQYGLTPKFTNPGQLLAYWREQLETTLANKKFLSTLGENGDILPSKIAPKGWSEVNIPFATQKYLARPELAHMLNGIFRDPAQRGLAEAATHFVAGVSRTAQEIALSAGIPKTDLNFYVFAQMIKHMYSGNFKAIIPFIRTNFESLGLSKSVENFFIDNQKQIAKMAEEGLDISSRVDNWRDLYKNTLSKRGVGQAIGETFDKVFNEATFNSFLPQVQIQLFNDAEKRFLAKGFDEIAARKMAAEAVRAFEGTTPELGRSTGTKDFLTAAFFAPKFREGIFRTFANTLKSATTEIKNPAFYMNRRLLAGLALTYATFDLLNKKLNGNHLWDNPKGHETELKFTITQEMIDKYHLDTLKVKAGDVVYVPWFPLSTTVKNLAIGGKSLLTGDFKNGTRKIGSMFSIPVQLTWEVLGNRDYFGNKIYEDDDPGGEKLKKIAGYVGLQVGHPFVTELYKVAEGKDPLYQGVSKALELPFKFSSEEKIATSEYYKAIEHHKAIREDMKDRVRPIYEQIREAALGGNQEEAQRLLSTLTKEEIEIFKDLKAADKRSTTNSAKSSMYQTYQKVKTLVQQGNMEEAQRIVNAFTPEEVKAFKALKEQGL